MVLLEFNGKGVRWYFWKNKQVDYESADETLVLKKKDFEEQKLFWFAGETEVKDLVVGVVGVLRINDFVEETLKLKIKIDVWGFKLFLQTDSEFELQNNL